MIGIGVMINNLSGNERSVSAYRSSVGKTIAAIEVANECLNISFQGGTTLVLEDDGQSCCEHRYMTCDDDLSMFVGDQLVGISIRDAPDVDDDGDCHEVQFLEVTTSKGSFQAANHNEHNGYYGGFAITCSIRGA